MLKESLLGWGGANPASEHKYLLDHRYAYIMDRYGIEPPLNRDRFKMVGMQLYAWTKDDVTEIYIEELGWLTRDSSLDDPTGIAPFAWSDGSYTRYTRSTSPSLYEFVYTTPTSDPSNWIIDLHTDPTNRVVVYTSSEQPGYYDAVFSGENSSWEETYSFYVTSVNTGEQIWYKYNGNRVVQDGVTYYGWMDYDRVANPAGGTTFVVGPDPMLYTTTKYFTVKPTFYTKDPDTSAMVLVQRDGFELDEIRTQYTRIKPDDHVYQTNIQPNYYCWSDGASLLYTTSEMPAVGDPVYIAPGSQFTTITSITIEDGVVVSIRTILGTTPRYSQHDILNLSTIDVPYNNTDYYTYQRDSSLDKVDTVSFYKWLRAVFPVALDGSPVDRVFYFDYTSLETPVSIAGIPDTQVWFDKKTQMLIAISVYKITMGLFNGFTRTLVQAYHPITGYLLDEHVIDGFTTTYNLLNYQQAVVNTVSGCYSFLYDDPNQPTLYFYFPKYHSVKSFEIDTSEVSMGNYSRYASLGNTYMNDDTWHAEPVLWTKDTAVTSSEKTYRITISPTTHSVELVLSGTDALNGSAKFAYNPHHEATYPGRDRPFGAILYGYRTDTDPARLYGYYADYGGYSNSVRWSDSMFMDYRLANEDACVVVTGRNRLYANLVNPSTKYIDGNLPYIYNLQNDGSSTGTVGISTVTIDPNYTTLMPREYSQSRRIARGPTYYGDYYYGASNPIHGTNSTIVVSYYYGSNPTTWKAYLVQDAYYGSENFVNKQNINVSSLSLYDLYTGDSYTNYRTLSHTYYGARIGAMLVNTGQTSPTVKKPVYLNVIEPTQFEFNQYCLNLWNNSSFNNYVSFDVSSDPYRLVCIADGDIISEYKTLKLSLANPGYAVLMTSGGLSTTDTEMKVPVGSQITYTVSYPDYITQTATVTLTEDTTIPISLYTSPVPVQLTITPAPSDATVTLTSTGVNPVSGTGAQTIEVMAGQEVHYIVEKTDFETQSGVLTPQNTINMTVEIEIPLAEVYRNTAPGNYSTTIDSKYNYVEIEFAGAGGGSSHGSSGKGAIRKITTGLTTNEITGVIAKKGEQLASGSGYQNGGNGTYIARSRHYSGYGGGSTSVVYNNTTATAGGGSGSTLVAHFPYDSGTQYSQARGGNGGGPNGGISPNPGANASAWNGRQGTFDSWYGYYNGKNATDSDAIGYNAGNGYVIIKAGWKAQYEN